MAEVPGVGHPAPVRVLPAQMSGGVNVREKFGESFIVGRSSPTLRSRTFRCPELAGLCSQPAVVTSRRVRCLRAFWAPVAVYGAEPSKTRRGLVPWAGVSARDTASAKRSTGIG